ncbi:MAG: hypothetical protein AB9897_03435 [Anaerolineaceae bacterium]
MTNRVAPMINTRQPSMLNLPPFFLGWITNIYQRPNPENKIPTRFGRAEWGLILFRTSFSEHF